MPQVAFGKFSEDDKRIAQDVHVCAVTGEKVRGGDEMRKIAGTKLFVRLKAGVGERLSEEAWDELVAKVKLAANPPPLVAPVAESLEPAPVETPIDVRPPTKKGS